MDWIRRKKRAASPKKSLAPDETVTESPTDGADSSDIGVLSASEKSPTGETSVGDGLGRTTSAISTDSNIIYPTGLPLAIVVVALCFAIFLVALDQTIIATAMYHLSRDFLMEKTSHNKSVSLVGGCGLVRFGLSLDHNCASTDVWENVSEFQFEGDIPRGGVNFRAWLVDLRRRSEQYRIHRRKSYRRSRCWRYLLRMSYHLVLHGPSS